MDRNTGSTHYTSANAAVALHPEGVDRNLSRSRSITGRIKSPSTRRAWIEILRNYRGTNKLQEVALHPEGVDRNSQFEPVVYPDTLSPSTRRAWIEIVSIWTA